MQEPVETQLQKLRRLVAANQGHSIGAENATIAMAAASLSLMAMLATAFPLAAFAGVNDPQLSPNENVPTLFALRDSVCAQDYAQELRLAGLGDVRIREFDRLDSVGKTLGLPTDVKPRHLLLANGYVFADHVAPDTVLRLLRDKPQLTGLVGARLCSATANHAEVDAAVPRRFLNR